MTTELLVALDGGNSKTDVLLLEGDGTVLARARSGSFAPHIIGADAAVGTFAAAVDAVLATQPGRTIGVVAGYLANADLPEEEQAIEEAIRTRGWAREVVVRNDTLAMLRAGTDDPHGVAVVCGGGINAVGIGIDGRVVRYPALGRTTGDWGGGYGLAKEVLWVSTRAEDGRGAPTALAAAVAAHFGVTTATEVATGMHLGTLDRDRLHELVPVLFQSALDGDEAAISLVRHQGEEIGLLAVTTLRRLDALDLPLDVVLGGGMLTSGNPVLLDPVMEAITTAAPKARIRIIDAAPIIGSALLGLEELDKLSGAHGSAPERRARILATLDSTHTEVLG